MAGAYSFKYLPLEGRFSGRSIEQQTENALNQIGEIAYTAQATAEAAQKAAENAAYGGLEPATDEEVKEALDEIFG